MDKKELEAFRSRAYSLFYRLSRNDAKRLVCHDDGREGYFLEDGEFSEALELLWTLVELARTTPPGPKSYRTWWEAYCGEEKYRRYIDAMTYYVRARGTERGKTAHALRAVAGDERDPALTERRRELVLANQDSLRKQIERWDKLPLTETEGE